MKDEFPVCRICAKEPPDGDALKQLFGRKHRKLLTQLQDITGILLKNSIGLPRLICSTCHQSLRDAHLFRENVLKVQASLEVKLKFSKRRHRAKGAIATEFVQVYVKEEKEVSKNDVEIDEEREINIIESQITYKKEEEQCDVYPAEINALELSPDDNLEDTKVTVLADKCDESDDATNFNSFNISLEDDRGNISVASSGNEQSCSDVEYNPNSMPPNKVKIQTVKRSDKQSKGSTKFRQGIADTRSMKAIAKENKPRKGRKDGDNHPNLFICDQCGNHFTCRHHFKLHLRRHTGDKQCACELCPDKFFTSSELRRHMRKHTGERPFACKFCERRFTDYSTRIKHERTHTNERPFMCSQCGKSFTTSYILKNHMLTHTGERHFKCDVCNKAFTRRTHLVVHFRSIMHKQAVEKEKLTTNLPTETQQSQRLIATANVPTFLV